MPEEAFLTAFLLTVDSSENSAEGSAERIREWDVLLDGALPAACSLVEGPCNPEMKFYALGALTLALQRIYSRLQVCLIPDQPVNHASHTYFRDRDCAFGLSLLLLPYFGGRLIGF